jgi:hypothetical protein
MTGASCAACVDSLAFGHGLLAGMQAAFARRLTGKREAAAA